MKKYHLKAAFYALGLSVHNTLTSYMHRSGLMLSAIAPELDAAAHTALPESQRGWYAAADDGKFKLDLSKVEVEDTAGLKGALEKERAAVKAAKGSAAAAVAEALKAFEGIDPVKTRALLSKFDNEEEAALIAAGKVDEVIAKRMSKRDAAQQKIIDAALEESKSAKAVTETFKGRVLDNHIRAAAAKAGLHAYAVDDALLRARSLFSLDERGEAIQLGTDGTPVLGKDGKSAFSPTEWLESMKEAAPHWFPNTGSGGGAGGSGNGSGGKTITRAAFDRLSPTEKATAVKNLQITD